tara:strand:- start:80 stop:1633 length:1554 start_codon:yes stop_codon:yes gene_type:complete
MSDAVDATQQKPTVSAHEINTSIAVQLANLVKSTLGPYGMDKELVDAAGDVVVTNDGASIVKQTLFKHPTAKIITEIARTQEENCFDGTTTCIVINGEFMDRAKNLIKKNIHPTRLAKGYNLANNKAQELLQEIALDVDDEVLIKVANTAMTGKSVETDQDVLAQICVDVTKSTTLDNISVVRRPNGKISDSLAISGLLVDREKVHHNMPDSISDAKIALIDVDITLPEFANTIQVQVTDNEAVKDFIESRKGQLQEIASKILSTGANVVLCLRDIDRFVAEYFAKQGIYAARRVAKSDMEALSKATGARIVSSIDELVEDDLGASGSVEEIMVGEKPIIKFTENKTNKAVSVLLRAPTQHVVDEVARAFEDALGVVSITIEDGKVVAGGGAPYLYLSKELKEYANSVSGREQMAVAAFADALEIIPASLAENSGLDPLDTLIALRQLHTSGSVGTYGVDVEEGGGKDMVEEGVLEPLRVVSQALQSASNVSSQLLRIDNILEMSRGPEIGEDGFNY